MFVSDTRNDESQRNIYIYLYLDKTTVAELDRGAGQDKTHTAAGRNKRGTFKLVDQANKVVQA